MEGPFDSAWLKWSWAVLQAELLKGDIDTYAIDTHGQAPYRTRRDYDAKHHCIILSIAEMQEFPQRWGLRLGDIVNNYRCCLDHIAWAVVQRGKTPVLRDWEAKGIYFPIAESRDDFNASLKGKRPKLPGVRRADLAIIRRYQPYRRGKRNLPLHVLAVLAKLSNDDKHRTVQPVWALPESAVYKVTDQRDCIVRRISPRAKREPLEVGTELARFYVKRTGPNPDIQVNGEIASDIAINRRLWLSNWLTETMRFTSGLLHEFAKPPASVREMIDGG